MRLVLAFCLVALLAGCETRQNPIGTPPPLATPALPQPISSASSAGAPHPVDTLDISRLYYATDNGRATTDTLVRLAGHRYRLLLQAQTDSSQPLRLTSSQLAPDTSADAPTLFEVRYRITLLDSVKHRVFQRVFTKSSFYRVMNKELVAQSLPWAAVFLGYNEPRKLLLFRQDFMLAESDVGGEVFLALDLHGAVQLLKSSNDYGGGGSDCVIQQSRSGRAIITCSDLLLPNGRHQSLQREGKLVAARFLSDTTLLTVHDYVTTQRVKDGESWSFSDIPIARLEHAPNAFILSANTGKVLARFRYEGFGNELGYSVPRQYIWQTQTYYLFDSGRQTLRVIPKNNPQQTTEVNLRQMVAFKPPQRPAEVRFRLATEEADDTFYLDTVTKKIRRQQGSAE